MSYGKLTLDTPYEILSVEKGSILSKPEDPTIAFTVNVNGKKIKAILTGEKAKVAWKLFLKDGRSMNKNPMIVDGISLIKSVAASMTGDIYDITKDEIKLKNPQIMFSFVYLLP